MAQLGSVLAPDAGGPRGPDLTVRVDVPRAALGDPDGVWVKIPLELDLAGELVPRAVSGHDDGDEIQLHLPHGFPQGGALRLRGQGGQQAGASDGDLLVQVQLTDGPMPARRAASHLTSVAPPTLFWLAAAVVTALAMAALLGG